MPDELHLCLLDFVQLPGRGVTRAGGVNGRLIIPAFFERLTRYATRTQTASLRRGFTREIALLRCSEIRRVTKEMECGVINLLLPGTEWYFGIVCRVRILKISLNDCGARVAFGKRV